ncbi:FAD-dependent oxidoreductase [Candidatus Margulisiibacteriota bacterium]
MSSSVLNTDVLVVGGGPSGAAAALSSARLGVKTLLVERYGFLGGMATAGLVNPFMVPKQDGKDLIGGIFGEIIDDLRSENACVPGELFGQPHIVFDTESLRSILLRKVRNDKVDLLLHSFADGTILSGSGLRGISTVGKSGQIRIFSKVVIDATGDADIAYYSKVRCLKGRESDHLTQPATLNFNLAGIDVSKMPNRGQIDQLFLQAKKNKEINVPREKILWFETTRPDELHFNVTRIPKVDGTDVFDMTKAEIEGRRQAEEVYGFMRRSIPGFENSYIVSTAAQVGFRETRRIAGEYLLTQKDILAGRQFDDAIALNNYPIDIHNPKGEGTIFKKLEKPYGIPFRCLIPKKIDSLIVAGRSISVTHEALSSVRIMPVCMAMGQASGTAGALCVKSKRQPRSLDIGVLKKELLNRGAVLEWK